MKTINNMKAMEINGEMLEQVIGGAEVTLEERRKAIQAKVDEGGKNVKNAFIQIGIGLLNSATFGLLFAANGGYELYKKVESIGLGA